MLLGQKEPLLLQVSIIQSNEILAYIQAQYYPRKYMGKLQANTPKTFTRKVIIDLSKVSTWHTFYKDEVCITRRVMHRWTFSLADVGDICWAMSDFCGILNHPDLMEKSHTSPSLHLFKIA